MKYYLVNSLTRNGLNAMKERHRYRWLKGLERDEKPILSDQYLMRVTKSMVDTFDEKKKIKELLLSRKIGFYNSNSEAWLNWLTDGVDSDEAILTEDGHYKMFYMSVEEFESLEKVKS